MYKATVIIPTFKPQSYIFECLDSIFSQTYNASCFELIIVLNGCCEPYKSELIKFIEKNAPVRENVYIIQTDTSGVSNARNIALNMANGENILFIDDDDIISPRYIESLLELASDDAIVAARLRLFDDITGEELSSHLTNAYYIAREDTKKRPLSLYTGRRLLSVVTGKTIPKKMIGTNRFNTSLSLGEDSVFMTQLANHIKHILIAPEDAVYNVRKRKDSASRVPLSNKKQVCMALSLAWRYTCMYMTDIRHNDLKFYASRIVASLLKAVHKKYRTV